MSSNRVPRVMALSTRLFLLYSTASAILAAVTLGSVYLAMRVQLDQETDNWLRATAKEVREQPDLAASQFDDSDEAMVIVLDASGNVISASSKLVRLFDVNKFPKGGEGVDRTSSDGKVFRLLRIVEDDRQYLLAQDRSFERDFMARFRRYIAIGTVPTFVVSLILGYLLTRLGTRPIRAVNASFKSISPNQLSSRVPIEGQPSDLRELSETLNSVLAKMQEAFSRLDAFSSDVAHELRTPVQNLRGSIEVSLSQQRSSEEYRTTLVISLNEVDRLARLVDRLLLLAQSEDPRAEIRRESLDLQNELLELKEFFAPQAAESSVQIEVDVPENLVFNLDKSLFQRCISNLVANSLAHTPPQGTIVIRAREESNCLCIEVKDNGNGIEQDELPFLFDRFYRSPTVRNAGRGVGLGLAIVKRVVDLHEAQVTIRSELGKGTAVTLSFPRV